MRWFASAVIWHPCFPASGNRYPVLAGRWYYCIFDRASSSSDLTYIASFLSLPAAQAWLGIFQ